MPKILIKYPWLCYYDKVKSWFGGWIGEKLAGSSQLNTRTGFHWGIPCGKEAYPDNALDQWFLWSYLGFWTPGQTEECESGTWVDVLTAPQQLWHHGHLCAFSITWGVVLALWMVWEACSHFCRPSWCSKLICSGIGLHFWILLKKPELRSNAQMEKFWAMGRPVEGAVGIPNPPQGQCDPPSKGKKPWVPMGSWSLQCHRGTHNWATPLKRQWPSFYSLWWVTTNYGKRCSRSWAPKLWPTGWVQHAGIIITGMAVAKLLLFCCFPGK